MPAAIPTPLPWHRNFNWLLGMATLSAGLLLVAYSLISRGDIYERNRQAWATDWADVVTRRGRFMYQWEWDRVLAAKLKADEDAEAYWSIARPIIILCFIGCGAVVVAFIVARVREEKRRPPVAVVCRPSSAENGN